MYGQECGLLQHNLQLITKPCLLLSTGERGDFHEIIEEYWRWRLEQVPEFASSVGVHDYEDKLELFNMQAYEHRKVRQMAEIHIFL